jgi:hypothetical protein
MTMRLCASSVSQNIAVKPIAIAFLLLPWLAAGAGRMNPGQRPKNRQAASE